MNVIHNKGTTMPHPSILPPKISQTPVTPQRTPQRKIARTEAPTSPLPPPLPANPAVLSGISQTLSLASPQNDLGVRLNHNTPAQKPKRSYWNYQAPNIVHVAGRKLSFVPNHNDKTQKDNTFAGKISYKIFNVGKYNMTYVSPHKQKLSVDLGSRGKGEIDIDGTHATVSGNPNGIKLPQNGVKTQIEGRGSSQNPFKISFQDRHGKNHEICWYSPSLQK
ncbi:MAG: hypothetical protein QGI45_13635 [Myxococcota bacterium]|nr:hypothetical protein [Myxococcota bacterium]